MPTNNRLFRQLSKLSTEQRNPRTKNLDALSVHSILTAINREDQNVPRIIAREIPYITKAVNLFIKAFRSSGRVIYVGAGTSGRLGILDASECPPTYGTNPEMIQGIIAGGPKAVFRSQEGSEDRADEARKEIRRLRISKNDVVCGIAASMRTPFVVAALQEAKKRGAKTILVSTNPRSTLKRKEHRALRKVVDVAICPNVGPEVVMGSTRMKAGTAQKLVLNMMTTTAMVRLGKVYENMMIDLQMTSKKLEERAKRVIMIATGLTYDRATTVLQKADYHVKTALVMIKGNTDVENARARLKRANGYVRYAIANQAYSLRNVR